MWPGILDFLMLFNSRFLLVTQNLESKGSTELSLHCVSSISSHWKSLLSERYTCRIRMNGYSHDQHCTSKDDGFSLICVFLSISPHHLAVRCFTILYFNEEKRNDYEYEEGDEFPCPCGVPPIFPSPHQSVVVLRKPWFLVP